MPTLKCAGTGHDLDCTVGDTPFTCNRIAENVLVCKDEDGFTHAFIGPRIQPSSPAATNKTKDSPSAGVTSELESIFDDLIVELYNNLKNGGSNFDTLRDAFEVISEIARTDPDLALDMIEDIRTYAIKSTSVDTQINCDLFSEIIIQGNASAYSLDDANAKELTERFGIDIDPQYPLTGLSEKLYPPLPEIDIFIEAIMEPAFKQGLILLSPSGCGKGFPDLDEFVNKLLTPSSEEE